jgi:hypothetical protein
LVGSSGTTGLADIVKRFLDVAPVVVSALLVVVLFFVAFAFLEVVFGFVDVASRRFPWP